VFEYLKRDAVSHADMLDPLSRGTGEVIYEGEDGVIFRETLSGIYFASMEDVEKCLAILGKYQATAFAVHQERTAKMLQQRHHFPEYHPCHQYVYPADTFGEAEMKHAGIDSRRLEQVQLLGAEYRDVVDRNYDAMDDPEYIGELIERKQLWGIFEQGELGRIRRTAFRRQHGPSGGSSTVPEQGLRKNPGSLPHPPDTLPGPAPLLPGIRRQRDLRQTSGAAGDGMFF